MDTAICLLREVPTILCKTGSVSGIYPIHKPLIAALAQGLKIHRPKRRYVFEYRPRYTFQILIIQCITLIEIDAGVG
jgi:hypothetical protein